MNQKDAASGFYNSSDRTLLSILKNKRGHIEFPFKIFDETTTETTTTTNENIKIKSVRTVFIFLSSFYSFINLVSLLNIFSIAEDTSEKFKLSARR